MSESDGMQYILTFRNARGDLIQNPRAFKTRLRAERAGINSGFGSDIAWEVTPLLNGTIFSAEYFRRSA